MNMSDDIAGAVINVSGRGVSEAARSARVMLEAILRLLRYLAKSRQMSKEKKQLDIQNKKILDIKGGKVSVKELLEHCMKNRDQLVSSEHGMTKEDAALLVAKAKKCGIPLALRSEKGKDNVYISFRQSDMPMFRQLSTELIKEKLETRPQELANFKCKEWEIPFINAELKQHDLSAQFAQTKSGEYLAIYERKDAKAIEIARSEFVRKANEVENSIEFSKDNDGFYNITDKISGKTLPFDDTPNRNFISRQLQAQFGYDENKANIAAQKFGKEMLMGDEKTRYFSDDPTTEFSYVSQVTWDNEDIMTKAYDCYYVTPKDDGISRVVYQDNEGRFAVLNPPRQTKAHMRNVLEEQLGIKDIAEQDALIAKAEHVTAVNARYRNIMGSNEELHTHEVIFTKAAFDLSDPEVASGMLRTDESGNTFTKTQPIDSISTSIQRKDTNTFEIKSVANATESDKSGQTHQVSQEQTLMLSFSNKKTALEELKEMYKSQGVPEAAAKDMAKSVFQKAELQNAETVISVEQFKKASIMVSDISQLKELPAANRKEAIEALNKEYGISAEEASIIYDKGIDNVQQRVNTVEKTKTDLNSALNRTTKREANKSDNIVICSSEEPNKHIVCKGSYNGDRVIHDYTTFNGTQKLGEFTDANTQDSNGNPIVEANGKYAWINLKNDMNRELNMSFADQNILVFDTEEAYQQYIADKAFLTEASNSMSDNVDISINGNGHEMHPEGNILAETGEKLSNSAEKLSAAADKAADKLNNVAEKIEDAPSRGGR